MGFNQVRCESSEADTGRIATAEKKETASNSDI